MLLKTTTHSASAEPATEPALLLWTLVLCLLVLLSSIVLSVVEWLVVRLAVVVVLFSLGGRLLGRWRGR